ncbi:unnamed protein product [Lactuca virosa]|uniref:Uncharacterized protein n=1 Tax=Lactuca virosa TaxID=75947 RepID=A0AAU9MDA3_9ASTR|nr:unnamed protein product [Lactuca virosa]
MGHVLEIKKTCPWQVEVERFVGVVLAGEFKHFRHLDISNREGLASDGEWFNRCYSASFIPIKQLLEERPNFCLVVEFPIGSYIEVEEATTTTSDVSLASQSSNHSSNSDGLLLMSTSDNSSDSGNEDPPETSFVTYIESSNDLDFLSA